MLLCLYLPNGQFIYQQNRPRNNSYLSGILRSHWKNVCEMPYKIQPFSNKIYILGRNLMLQLLHFKETFGNMASETSNSKKIFDWFILSYIMINLPIKSGLIFSYNSNIFWVLGSQDPPIFSRLQQKYSAWFKMMLYLISYVRLWVLDVI